MGPGFATGTRSKTGGGENPWLIYDPTWGAENSKNTKYIGYRDFLFQWIIENILEREIRGALSVPIYFKKSYVCLSLLFEVISSAG